MRFETADLRQQERSLGISDAEADSLAAAMRRLGDGGKCEECKWQKGALVTQRRRVLCQTCAKCDRAYRDVEATALRVNRQGQKRG